MPRKKNAPSEDCPDGAVGCLLFNHENGTSGRFRPTPAMMAGIVDTLWKFDDLYDEVMK